MGRAFAKASSFVAAVSILVSCERASTLQSAGRVSEAIGDLDVLENAVGFLIQIK